MRIVSWNIKGGGVGREEVLASALGSHNPDLVVLQEYFPDRSSELKKRLIEDGFEWVHSAEPTEAPPRVLIASKMEFTAVEPSAPDLELRNRWAEVYLRDAQLRIAGVYVPVTGRQPTRKRLMWQAVRRAASVRSGEPFLIVGDWNTGDHPADKSHPGRPFKFTDEYRELLGSGYVEAWRHKNPDVAEFSWYQHSGRGFRIDHAFVSPVLLPRVKDCRFSHAEREAGTSDHSLLIVDVMN